MIKSILTACLALALVSAVAQHPVISGSVRDTAEKKPLANAVVSIISAKDSTLLKFVRTKADGSFSIKDIPGGAYMLMVTYPKFADYIETVTIKDGAHQIGIIPMTPLSQLLEEVVIKQQRGAMRIRGDTIAYIADSFAVKEGSSVEDLLKQLPGIQVDKSGKITAQGQEVKKVLLDGEEFFSDDPAVVTQNLGADVVKEVQVFDKKSEQAEFTGVDDGKTQKTINLKIKPEKKKGYFGKGTLAGGTRETFDNDLMVNRFKGDRKISAYGIMSNTGRTMLGWNEREQYGGNNVEYNEEEGWFEWRNNSDDFESRNDGLPTAWTAGLHYSDKMNDDKINFNYRVLKKNMRANTENKRQDILLDTQYFNNTSTKSFDSRTMHKLDGSYDWQIDSMSSIKLKVGGNSLSGETNSLTTNNSLILTNAAANGEADLVNDNRRQYNTNSSVRGFNSSLLWRQRFKKKGRTLSLSVSQKYDDRDLTGLLQSVTNFYEDDVLNRTELIDQQKKNSGSQSDLATSLIYTEPLGKAFLFSVSAGYHTNNSQSKVTSLNKDGASGEYDDIDAPFSNDFKYQYDVSSGGLALKYTKGKLKLNVGGAANYAVFNQKDLIKDTASKYDYINLFPRAGITYTFSPQSRISLDYRGQTKPPGVQQLQPLSDNTDPLNIQIGNPALRQEFTHNFTFSINDFKILTNRYIGSFIRYTFTQNAISMSQVVDPGGKRISQAINVDGNSNGMLYLNWGAKIPKTDWNVGAGTSAIYSVYNSIINLAQNRTTNYSIGPNIYQRKYVEDKYSFEITEGISYNYTRSSLTPDQLTKYFTGNLFARGEIELPWKLSASTTFDANFRQKIEASNANTNSIKWDATLSRKFFKGNKGELRFEINDILNQNIGFERTATSNFISERTYDTFKRYAMLRFLYRFSKTPGATPGN